MNFMSSNFRSATRFTLIFAIAVSLMVSAPAQSHPERGQNDSAVAVRMQRVENGIPPIPLSATEPPLQLNIEKLMQLYKVSRAQRGSNRQFQDCLGQGLRYY